MIDGYALTDWIALVVGMAIGSAFVPASVRWWARPAAATIAGVALVSAVGLVRILLPLDISGGAIWGVAGGVALAFGMRWRAIGSRAERPELRGQGLDLLAWALLLLALVTVVRAEGLMSLHSDSMRYTVGGEVLARGDIEVLRSHLPKYGLTQYVLHVLHASLDRVVWLSLSPALALSVTVLLAETVHRVGVFVGARNRWVVAGLAGALLATSPWLLWHAAYFNAHLLTGAFLLLLVRIRLEHDERTPERGRSAVVAHVILQGALVASLVGARPYVVFVLGVLLLPDVLADGPLRRGDVAVWRILGVSGVAFAVLSAPAGQWDIDQLAILVAGVGALVVTPLRDVLRRLLGDDQTRLLWLLWILVLVSSVRRPAITIGSLASYARNFLTTGLSGTPGGSTWGFTIIGLLALWMVGSKVSDPTLRSLRSRAGFAFLAYLPISLILAHARGSGYRFGRPDSMNRMWIEVLAFAVLYVMVAFLVPGTDDPADGREARRASGVPLLAGTVGILVGVVALTSLPSLAGQRETVSWTIGPTLSPELDAGELIDGARIDQPLAEHTLPDPEAFVTGDPLCVEVRLATYLGRPIDGTIAVILDDGQHRLVERIDAGSVADNSWNRTCFPLDARAAISAGRPLMLSLVGEGSTTGRALTAMLDPGTDTVLRLQQTLAEVRQSLEVARSIGASSTVIDDLDSLLQDTVASAEEYRAGVRGLEGSLPPARISGTVGGEATEDSVLNYRFVRPSTVPAVLGRAMIWVLIVTSIVVIITAARTRKSVIPDRPSTPTGPAA